jgi:hypothetical protein
MSKSKTSLKPRADKFEILTVFMGNTKDEKQAAKLEKILGWNCPITIAPSSGVWCRIHLTSSQSQAMKLAAQRLGESVELYARKAIHCCVRSDMDEILSGSI